MCSFISTYIIRGVSCGIGGAGTPNTQHNVRPPAWRYYDKGDRKFGVV